MKRTLNCILAVLLALSVLAGCGKNAASRDSSSADPTASTSAPEQEPSSSEPAQTDPDPDLSQPQQNEPAQEPEKVEDLDEDGTQRLLNLFQKAYDSAKAQNEAQPFESLEALIAYEMDLLPLLAEADDASLPEDYMEFYLDWRPGGIGGYQLSQPEEPKQPDVTQDPAEGDVMIEDPTEGDVSTQDPEDGIGPSHDTGWEPGLG